MAPVGEMPTVEINKPKNPANIVFTKLSAFKLPIIVNPNIANKNISGAPNLTAKAAMGYIATNNRR